MSTPENANEGCIGPSHPEAGTKDGCQGCPNQQQCQQGPIGPDPDIGRIQKRLENVRHIILVLSGKGGVGKSSLTAQLGFLLSQRGHKVGICDMDICGPSIPRLLGTQSHSVSSSSLGLEPIPQSPLLSSMSIEYLLTSKEDAVVWRGPKKNGLVKQFLQDVHWGALDYLLVDTPPGTSDEHISLAQYLSTCNAGCIIITCPQEVSLQDVRKEIRFCEKVKLPIYGMIENMTQFTCPHCSHTSNLFPTHENGVQGLSNTYGYPYWGGIPLDPHLAQSSDAGSLCKGPALDALTLIVEKLMEKCPVE